MRYRVTHRTSYEYDQPVSTCYNVAHLCPRETERQRRLQAELNVEPAPASRAGWLDFFGNPTTYFTVQVPHRRLTVTAITEVELQTEQGRAADPGPAWEDAAEALLLGTDSEAIEARQYRLPSPFVASEPALAAYARPSFPPGRPLLSAVAGLMERIHLEFRYDPDFSTVATPLAAVLAHRRGVCQDFAHLAIGCLRSLGLPARYVSGYLETVPPPGASRLQGADASHAWFAVFVPGQGWCDFDPTNNRVPMNQHITTAWGRDYGDVTPLKGVILGGGKHRLRVSVDVERLADA